MRTGDLIDNYDLVDGHTEQVCQDHQIVNGRHGIAAHPFEDRLRRIEATSILNIAYFETFGFDEVCLSTPKCTTR